MDGKKKSPYSENDKTNPVNYYGFTKCEGEKYYKRDLKFRNNQNFMAILDLKDNFLQNILNQFNNNKELRVVNNRWVSYIFYDPALFILKSKKLIQIKPIYNFSNEGFCSRYEQQKKFLKLWKNQ